jgi:hypothetical protein
MSLSYVATSPLHLYSGAARAHRGTVVVSRRVYSTVTDLAKLRG